MLELIPPTIRYGDSFPKQMRRKVAHGLHPIGDNAIGDLCDQITRWQELAQELENSRYEYWLVHDNEYIGTFQLRRKESGVSTEMASHVYWEIDSEDHRDSATLNALFELGIARAKGKKFSSLTFVVSEADTVRTEILESHGGIRVADIVSPIDGARHAKYRLDLA